MVALHERVQDGPGRAASDHRDVRLRLRPVRAAAQFKRMVLRGLDYLPPGEVTFADFGRAILAADQASFEDDTWRLWLRGHFVKRGIVTRAADLDVKTNVANRGRPRASTCRPSSTASGSPTRSPSEPRSCSGSRPTRSSRSCQRIVVEGRFESARGRPSRGGRAAQQPRGRRRPTTTTRRRTADTDTRPSRSCCSRSAGAAGERTRATSVAQTRRIQTGSTLVIDWNQRRDPLAAPTARLGGPASRRATRCSGASSRRGLVEVIGAGRPRPGAADDRRPGSRPS